MRLSWYDNHFFIHANVFQAANAMIYDYTVESQVNNETIRDVDTAQVIDTMRKTRGAINITILRKPQPESSESTAANDRQ